MYMQLKATVRDTCRRVLWNHYILKYNMCWLVDLTVKKRVEVFEFRRSLSRNASHDQYLPWVRARGRIKVRVLDQSLPFVL